MSSVPVADRQQPPIVCDAVFANVRNVDLSNVIRRLCEPESVGGKGWSTEKAEEAASLYREFLVLCMLHHHEALVPTKLIDDVWHQHILDTRKYEEDCYAVFGKFLHHSPDYRPDSSKELRDSRFALTRDLFMKEFGHDLRSDSALCSACYCDPD
jgi:hypothetical protein